MRTTVRRRVVATTRGVAPCSCGGDDDDTGGGGEAGGGTTTTAAADAAAGATTTVAAGATTTTAAPVDDAVPDPCTLIPGPELAMMLAADRAGESSAYDRAAEDLQLRPGVILAVELADHYDTAIDIIRDETGEVVVHEVSGVGNAAVWQDIGDGMGRSSPRGTSTSS